MYSVLCRPALQSSRIMARQMSSASRRGGLRFSVAKPLLAVSFAGLVGYSLATPILMDSPVSADKLAEKAEKPVDKTEPDEEKGAYDPETGEINWDCPCLGGMAHGPCGEEFKAAFSCFVYSKEEPKGIDCVEKFKGMQECFKKYPEVYAEELREDDEYGQVPEASATEEVVEVVTVTQSQDVAEEEQVAEAVESATGVPAEIIEETLETVTK